MVQGPKLEFNRIYIVVSLPLSTHMPKFIRDRNPNFITYMTLFQSITRNNTLQ